MFAYHILELPTVKAESAGRKRSFVLFFVSWPWTTICFDSMFGPVYVGAKVQWAIMPLVYDRFTVGDYLGCF